MALTPNMSLPYPIPDDTVDVPRDIKALADKLDVVTKPKARVAGTFTMEGGTANGGSYYPYISLWPNFSVPAMAPYVGDAPPVGLSVVGGKISVTANSYIVVNLQTQANMALTNQSLLCWFRSAIGING